MKQKIPQAAAEKFAAHPITLYRPDAGFWISWAAGFGVYMPLVYLVHWNEWQAIVPGIVVAFLARISADMWPRRVPPELADGVANLEKAGWRKLRRHPFLCVEKYPHVHMIDPAGIPWSVIWRGEDGPPSLKPGQRRIGLIIPADGSEMYWEEMYGDEIFSGDPDGHGAYDVRDWRSR